MELAYAIFSIAAIFSPLAATVAFLITYQEYAHHYPDRKKVVKASLKAAFFTFVFFLGLGLLLALILPLCY